MHYYNKKNIGEGGGERRGETEEREREKGREKLILNDRKLGKDVEGTDILKFISFTVRVFGDLLIWANFKAGTF